MRNESSHQLIHVKQVAPLHHLAYIIYDLSVRLVLAPGSRTQTEFVLS